TIRLWPYLSDGLQQPQKMISGGQGILQGDPEPKVPPDQRFNNIVGPIPQESLVDPSVGPIGVPAKVVPEADNVALWHHGQIKIITLSDQGRKFPGQTIQRSEEHTSELQSR